MLDKNFFCLHISKADLPCLFLSAACESDVIVIYDVIEHI